MSSYELMAIYTRFIKMTRLVYIVLRGEGESIKTKRHLGFKRLELKARHTE